MPVSPGSGRSARGTVGALLALALVSTAAAPGVVRISRGDTLSELASRHGVSVAALKAANGLSTDRIVAGGTLVLPAPRIAATTARTTERSHVVARGRDRHRHRAAATAPASRRCWPRNGLSSRSLLQPGARLVVPVTVRTVGGSTAATTATTAVGGSVSASAAHLPRGARRPAGAEPDAGPRDGRRDRPAARRRARRWPWRWPTTRAASSSASCPASAPIGVMQVLPSTGRAPGARRPGGRWTCSTTEDNVTAGVLLLRQLLRLDRLAVRRARRLLPGPGLDRRQGHAAADALPTSRSIAALQPRFANG